MATPAPDPPSGYSVGYAETFPPGWLSDAVGLTTFVGVSWWALQNDQVGEVLTPEAIVALSVVGASLLTVQKGVQYGLLATFDYNVRVRWRDLAVVPDDEFVRRNHLITVAMSPVILLLGGVGGWLFVSIPWNPGFLWGFVLAFTLFLSAPDLLLALGLFRKPPDALLYVQRLGPEKGYQKYVYEPALVRR